MKKLLEKIIIKVEMAGTDEIVFTDINGKTYQYTAYGGCYSISWFSHITGLKNLLGQKINSVEERVEFTDEEQKKAEEEYLEDEQYKPGCLQLYGIMLKTNKGTCDIEFRNESNGYYGGNCDFSGYKKENLDWKEILADF